VPNVGRRTVGLSVVADFLHRHGYRTAEGTATPDCRDNAIPGLPDDETVRQARALFEEKRETFAYDGFEVWDLARVVFQYPTPIDDKPRDGE
jgi:hypothetical protein